MADRGADRHAGKPSSNTAGPVDTNTAGQSQPTDAGKTSGGGSLGHDQPAGDQSRIRNEGGNQRPADVRDRQTPDPLPELEP
jgi:hypothetical protein